QGQARAEKQHPAFLLIPDKIKAPFSCAQCAPAQQYSPIWISNALQVAQYARTLSKNRPRLQIKRFFSENWLVFCKF
ncbi:hypothetical protein, partial [Pseudomonas syringae group genomosp. 7]